MSVQQPSGGGPLSKVRVEDGVLSWNETMLTFEQTLAGGSGNAYSFMYSVGATVVARPDPNACEPSDDPEDPDRCATVVALAQPFGPQAESFEGSEGFFAGAGIGDPSNRTPRTLVVVEPLQPVTEVPVPAALALIGGGLVTLRLVRRRR